MIRIKQGLAMVVLVSLWCGAAAAAERMAVTVSKANIRSGAGETYDIVWQVGKYHPIRVTKKSGAWYQFQDFEGDAGWIHKSLVGNVDTVITAKDKCNVRSGPGTKNEELFQVDRGIPFKVIKRQKNWLNVVHADGDSGWLHQSLVW